MEQLLFCPGCLVEGVTVNISFCAISLLSFTATTKSVVSFGPKLCQLHDVYMDGRKTCFQNHLGLLGWASIFFDTVCGLKYVFFYPCCTNFGNNQSNGTYIMVINGAQWGLNVLALGFWIEVKNSHPCQ